MVGDRVVENGNSGAERELVWNGDCGLIIFFFDVKTFFNL